MNQNLEPKLRLADAFLFGAGDRMLVVVMIVVIIVVIVVL